MLPTLVSPRVCDVQTRMDAWTDMATWGLRAAGHDVEGSSSAGKPPPRSRSAPPAGPVACRCVVWGMNRVWRRRWGRVSVAWVGS